MTTAAAAASYLAQHQRQWDDAHWAVFNPQSKPIDELPVIYGFNNGGSRDWWHAQLIAEDGTGLGGHLCSAEGYMPHDLGILEGSRPDRHESFRQHYPGGYRMAFVPYTEIETCEALQAAFKLNEKLAADAPGSAQP